MDTNVNYFDSQYEDYYNNFTEGNGYNSQNLSNYVGQVKGSIDSVISSLSTWKGAAGDSYGEVASLLSKRFEDIKSNIDSSLTPACQAMDKLKDKLKEFKDEQKKLDELNDEKKKLEEELADLEKEQEDAQEAFDKAEEALKEEEGRNNPCDPDTNDYDRWESSHNASLTQLGEDKAAKEKELNDIKEKVEKKNEEIDDKKQEIKEQDEKVKKIKKECDDLISKIKKLESNIREFSDMAGFTSEFSSGDFSKMPDLADMKYSERTDYLNNLVENYKVIYDGLNDYFEDHYGNGLEFSNDDFKKIDELFDTFDIYWMSKVERKYLVKDESSDVVLFDINKLSQVMSYCDSNDVFSKIGNYVNGQSWQKSGLEKLYDGFWDSGSANFMNTHAYNEDLLKQRLKDKYGVTGDVREYLKKNYSSVIDSVTNLKDSYKEYTNLYSTMAVVKSKIDNINNALKLLPYESYMDSDNFKSFMDIDYSSNYDGLSRDMLGKLDKQEVALYEYLRSNVSSKDADDYLQILQKTIVNEREGMKKAKAYIDGLKKNGFDVGDLLTSGWEGTKDGVRNFFDGIADVFRVANTGDGEYSELDYEMRYKAQFMQELMADEAYLDPNFDHDTLGLFNINNWYNTGSSVGNMLVPSVVGFIPVVGHGLSTALMTASITGNTAVQAKQEGYSTGQAYLYGALSGASETFTEVMFGGIPGISRLEGKGFIAGMISEGLEEFAQEYMDTGLKALVLHEPVELGLTAMHERFSNAAQAGVQGALTSGVMQIGNSVIGVGANKLTKAVSPALLDSNGNTITGINGKLVKKYNSFAEFKNSIESEHYTGKANNQIESAMSKLESGENLNIAEKIELNKAIKNISAEELADITKNLTKEQTNSLENATKGLPFVSKKTSSKIETSNYIKEMNSSDSNHLPTEHLTKSILREEATRDGRTVAEYIADSKSNALDAKTIREIEYIDSKSASEITNKVEKNQKAFIKELSKLRNKETSNTTSSNDLSNSSNNQNQTKASVVSNQANNSLSTDSSVSNTNVNSQNVASANRVNTSFNSVLNNNLSNSSNNQNQIKASVVSNQANNSLSPASSVSNTNLNSQNVASANRVNTSSNSVLNNNLSNSSNNQNQTKASVINNQVNNSLSPASSVSNTNASPSLIDNLHDVSSENNVLATASSDIINSISFDNFSLNSGATNNDKVVLNNTFDSSNSDSNLTSTASLGIGTSLGIGLNSLFSNISYDSSNNNSSNGDNISSFDNKGINNHKSSNSLNSFASPQYSSNRNVLSDSKYSDISTNDFDSYTNRFTNDQVSNNDDAIMETAEFYGATGDFNASNSALKDISYVLNTIQNKNGVSFERAMEYIEKVVQTGNYRKITRDNNARNILLKYSTSEIADIINDLNRINNVTDSEIKKVELCINQLIEHDFFSRNEAIEILKKVIDTGNYDSMSINNKAKKIIQEFSIEKLGTILNKIEIDVYINHVNKLALFNKNGTIPIVNSIAESVNFNNAPNYIQLSFEKNGSSSSSTYGVSQNRLYGLFTFVDKLTGDKYSYREAKNIYRNAITNHDVLPKFSKRPLSGYNSFKNNVMNRYNLSSNDASIIIESIDDKGACSYADVCNEIFSSFIGKETEFESKFGFPMYEDVNGHRVFNSKDLLFDLYLNVNSYSGDGLILKTENGFKINPDTLDENNVDPLGRKLLDTDKQKYLSNSQSKTKDLISRYLNERGVFYNSTTLKRGRVYFDEHKMTGLIKQVISGLSMGKKYSLTISASGFPITLFSADNSSYNSVSTTDWNEGNGHAVFVTGVSKEGFVVSSWGKKFIVAFSDLIDNGAWSLTEDVIDLADSSQYDPSPLKKLKKIINDKVNKMVYEPIGAVSNDSSLEINSDESLANSNSAQISAQNLSINNHTQTNNNSVINSNAVESVVSDSSSYVDSYPNSSTNTQVNVKKINHILNKIESNNIIQSIDKLLPKKHIKGIPSQKSIVKHVNFNNASNNLQHIFENSWASSSSTYGVDQGTFYSTFTFQDNATGINYSYEQAKNIYNEAISKHEVLPNFTKFGTDEYFFLKEKFMYKYGISLKDVSIIIQSINDLGACSYATICNEILSAFVGKEREFESKFGFPMYVESNGMRVFNSRELLFDLYLNVNSYGGNGLIIRTNNGFVVNSRLLKDNVDPLGRKILDSNLQLNLSGASGKNQFLINQYLNGKGILFNSKVIKYYSDFIGESLMSEMINIVMDGLSKGKFYSLGIYTSGRPITMYSPNTHSYSSVSTTNWSEGGGHSIFITGITEDGFTVSSWGKKYIIPYSDLVNNGAWTLTEEVMDLNNFMRNDLFSFY